MSNPIVQALEQAAERIGRSLTKDAGTAIEDMYRSASKGTADVVKRITETDAERASKLVDIAEKLGNRFLARAKTAESRISPVVTGIKDDVPGAEIAGYPEYVLKSAESFKRKLATTLDRSVDRNLDVALEDMKDSVRYTLKFPSEGSAYADGVNTVIDRFHANGFENVKFKNTWGSPGYQAINSFWRDSGTGHVFEMQFHTPQSFDAKMITHGLYEEQRLPDVSVERRLELMTEQGRILGSVPAPEGASGLQLRKE